jgi:hypothetical protein
VIDDESSDLEPYGLPGGVHLLANEFKRNYLRSCRTVWEIQERCPRRPLGKWRANDNSSPNLELLPSQAVNVPAVASAFRAIRVLPRASITGITLSTYYENFFRIRKFTPLAVAGLARTAWTFVVVLPVSGRRHQ